MNKLAFLFLLCLTSCTWGSPPCPGPGENDKLGMYVRTLGTLNIDGENCTIFETYENTYCFMRDGFNHEPETCDGKYMTCSSKVLTRITKCPSGTISNTITYTSDKFHREQIQ